MNAYVDPAELVRAFCQGIHSPGYEDRVGYYQYTYSGGIFFPCDPRPEEVFIADIAAGLSRIGRFNGQTKRMVSPGEHSYIASEIVPRQFALEALMHDAPEGYIGDQIRSIKYIPAMGNVYLPIEDGIARAIAERFHLTYPWPKEVLLADEAMQWAETRDNIQSTALNNLCDATVKAANVQLYYWEPEMTRIMFLARFEELAKERGITIY